MFLVWPNKFEKYFEFYVQLICCLKKKREIVWNLNFWENWVLNLGFVKIFSSHTHAFFFNSSMLWGEVASNSVDFQKFIFLQFQSIESVFRSIKIAFKNFSEPLPGSIDRTCFWINRTSWIKFFFFLNTVFDSFKTLFQNFFKLSSLSPTWQGSTEDFLSFSTKFFARFFSPKAGKTFIPLILLLFSWFHA